MTNSRDVVDVILDDISEMSEREIDEIKSQFKPSEQDFERQIHEAFKKSEQGVKLAMATHKYRVLKEGEVIQAGDLSLCDVNNEWKPVRSHMVGRKCSSPLYSSHSIYKRLSVSNGSDL